MTRRQFLLAVLVLSTAGAYACGGSESTPTYDAKYTLPVLPDWACPADWTATPAFTSADGKEDTPKGLTQFNRCAPPASWDGPSGPAQLTSPATCPTGWTRVEHATLLDTAGKPYAWCEPPKVARIFAPGENADGSDYLSPIPDGATASDYQQCDTSKAMMPALWGTDCVHIGDACPTGTFPTIPATVTGNRIYVLAGSSGGTGSEAAPLATIAAAVTAASAGDVIVVGAGTYAEPIVVDKALTIWGACVEQVKLADVTSVADSDGAAILVKAPLLLKNVELSSTGMGILQQQTGDIDALVAEGVYFHRTTRRALYVSEGRAVVRDSLVFQSELSGQGYGRGLQANGENGRTSQLKVERVVIERVGLGLMAFGEGSVVDASDVFVRNTFADGPEPTSLGPAAGSAQGGKLVASRFQAELCEGGALKATDAGVLELEDAYIGNARLATQGTGAGNWGHGLEANTSGQVTVRRTVFHNLTGNALRFFGSATGLIEDVLITDTHKFTGNGGQGIFLRDGANVNAKRVVVAAGERHGFQVNAGSKLEATDVVSMDHTSDASTNDVGAGIRVEGGEALVERALFARCAGVGMLVTKGAKAELTDMVIRDTVARHDDDVGYGIEVSDEGSATLNRVVLAGNLGSGLFANGGGAKVEATDLLIRDTKPLVKSGTLGLGVGVLQDATLSLLRAAVIGSHFIGINSEGLADTQPGSSVNLRLKDVLVTDTTLDTDDGDGVGVGVVLQQGHVAELENVVIRRSLGAGLAVLDRAQAKVTGLVVTDTAPTGGVSAPGHYGFGLDVERGSSVQASKLLIEGSRDSGAVFMDIKPSSLSDVVIRGTTLGECSQYDPSKAGYCLKDGETAVSRGLALVGPGELNVTRFELSENGTMGAQVMVGADAKGEPYKTGGTLTLTEGGILQHEAGVCLQGLPGYDESKLKTDVYWDNEATIAYENHVGPL